MTQLSDTLAMRFVPSVQRWEDQMTTAYALSMEIPLPYEDAVKRTREELGKEGFGVLTEIDVKQTLKEKLDVDFRRYIILGACNPPIAHEALSRERDLGLLLPCNVVVYEGDDPGKTVVAAIDPVVQIGVAHNEELKPLAEKVRDMLQRALDSLAA